MRDQPLEVGVRFRAAEDGFITALRFFKQANNAGTHVAHLWSGSGQLLATAPYANESASGWQTRRAPEPGRHHQGHGLRRLVLLPRRLLRVRPVLLHAGPRHRHADRAGGRRRRQRRLPLRRQRVPGHDFNGTNYWVDATFDRTVPPDTRGPSVTGTVPTTSASDVARDIAVSATFDEPLTAGSISGSTFTLRDASDALVPATVSYDAQTRTARLVPTAPLAFQGAYTARSRAAPAVSPTQPATRMTADKAWTFTVAGQSPTDGPGGPILVLTDPADKFDTYYAEILRGRA